MNQGPSTGANLPRTAHPTVVPQRIVAARKDTQAALRRLRSPHSHARLFGGTAACRSHPVGSTPRKFLFSELLKSAAWLKERISIFHYRDKDQVEVDFVLENTAGEVVGIEVKAAASITRRDFAGLDCIAASAGAAFILGILLYDGEQTLSFGDKLRAAPLSALWA